MHCYVVDFSDSMLQSWIHSDKAFFIFFQLLIDVNKLIWVNFMDDRCLGNGIIQILNSLVRRSTAELRVTSDTNHIFSSILIG